MKNVLFNLVAMVIGLFGCVGLSFNAILMALVLVYDHRLPEGSGYWIGWSTGISVLLLFVSAALFSPEEKKS